MALLPLLLLVRSVSGQPTDLDRAWDLAAKGQAPQAIALLRELTQKQPANADVRLLLGSLLMETGDCHGSTAQLSEATRLRSRSPEAANALGETQRSCGDAPAALASFTHAVEYNPNYALGQLNLGQSLLEAHNEKEAALHLDRAIRLFGKKDDAADAQYLRAKLWADGGSPKQAAAALESAVAIRPRFAQAWSDLGYIRQQLGDDPGAIAAYKKAVALAPDDPVAQYRAGAEYLKINDVRSAIPALQAAYRLNAQDQSTLNALQTAFRADGRTVEADQIKTELRRLLRDRDRQSQNALTAVRLNNEGAALEKSGDVASAVAKYREAAQLAPDHNGIRVNYAVALLRTGQWTEGLNLLHEAAKREPANAQIQTALRDALSQAPPQAIPQWPDQPSR